MILYPITPVPYARRNRRTPITKPAVARYLAFKDEVKRYRVQVPERPFMVFYMPTAKADRWGLPHAQTPDKDNLVKALWDSAQIEGGKDDRELALSASCKVWSHAPGILIGSLAFDLESLPTVTGDAPPQLALQATLTLRAISED